mgnify:CR=1 FL=1
MKTVKSFFDHQTFTMTYLVYDTNSKDAIIIDPVLDFDQAASTITTQSIEEVLDFIEKESLIVHYILETHIHADHLSGARELKKKLPQTLIGIGENVKKVQSKFKEVYNFKDFNANGVQFDMLLSEDTLLEAGSIKIKTIFTPGHTPACSSYLIEDMVFTGDALFMPDYGTGRCDFPMGSAKQLYHSVYEKLYKLPNATRVFTCHDYLPNGRELKYETTIGESKKNNIQLSEATSERDFVEFREKRDKTLKSPQLLYPSIQVNIRAGSLPAAEDNDVSYLKIPVRRS